MSGVNEAVWLMIELCGITWDHSRGFNPLIATAGEFQQLYPEVQIRWEKRSLHEFGHTPVDQLADQYDLVVLDHPWIGFMAEKQCYLALDQWISTDLLDDLKQNSIGPSHVSYSWNGHQWALPIDAATPCSSYRPDLLSQFIATVPQSWNDVLELGQRCHSNGKGIALPLGPVDAMTAFLSLSDNLGGSPFSTREQVVSTEIGLEVFAMLQAVLRYCPARVFELTPITLMEWMSRTDELVYCPLAYSYSNYSRSGYRPNLCRYGIMPVFQGHGPRGSHLGGTGLAVSCRCQHPQVAIEYAGKVAGAEWQSGIYFHSGGQPAHRAAWDSAEVNAACHDFFRDTRRTIDHAFLRPRYRQYIDFQYTGGAMVTCCLRERGNVRELLLQLNDLYRKSLREV